MSAIAITNLVDISTITPSGANALTPATKLQNEHVSDKWRMNATSAYLIFDMLTSRSVDSVALMGVSGVNPAFQVRMSLTDATVTGSLVAGSDTGSISGLPYFDPDYGKFVKLYATPLTTRYLRIDISEAAVAYIEAGRALIALRNTFGINFKAPWSRIAVRKSSYTRGIGGSTFVDRRKGTWRQNASFEFLSEAERTGFLDDLAIFTVNGGHADFLWIPDTAATNLARECIWGFHAPDEMTITQNLYCVPAVYSLDLQIEDRG